MRALFLPTIALFARAMRDDARSKYPVIIRVVAVSFLLFMIVLADAEFASSTAAGLTLLAMIAMVNFFGLTLYALGSFSSAITEEKEDETLGLMRMTRLGPVSILIGKGGARLAGGLLFLSVQIPFTILCVALGGVSTDQILRVYAILAAYVFFHANLGLLCSVISKRTSKAVGIAFSIGAVIYVLPFFIWFSRFDFSMMQGDASALEMAARWLLGINPLFDLVGTVFGRMGFPIRADSTGFHLVGGVVCFGIARLVFERFCGTDAALAAPRARAKRKSVFRRSRAWRFALGWKDFNFQAGGRKGLIVRFTLYLLLAIGIVVWMHRNDRFVTLGDIGGMVRGTAIMVFSMELGIAASRVFGRERKQKTLGSIFILPMNAGRLAWHKTIGNALGLLASAALWMIGTFIVNVAERDSIFGGGGRRSGDWTSGRPVKFPEMFGLDSQDVFVIAQYVFFAALIAWLTLMMRRGALLTGLLAAFIGNIIVQIIYSKMQFRGWSNANYAEMQDTFERGFYLGAAFLTLLLATILIVAIPRRLATCAAEE